MADMMVAAEIGGGALQPGRHYIPTCPYPAQLIQRGELPGQIERFGINDGKGADQADMLRHHGRRRQDSRRPEADDIMRNGRSAERWVGKVCVKEGSSRGW